MSESVEIVIKEVEVAKINLQPGDLLTVTVKSNEIHDHQFEALQRKLASVFPNNQVMVLGLDENSEVKFSVTGQIVQGCSTTSYCSDCNCGKKEQAESK